MDLKEVESSVKSMVSTVEELKNDQKELFQTLEGERKTYEEILASKADGKAISDLQEKLEKFENAHNELQEKLTNDIAEIKLNTSNSAPKSSDDEIKSVFYEHLRTGDFGSLSEKSQNILANEVYEYNLKCKTPGVRSLDQVKGMLSGNQTSGGSLVIPPVISNQILRMMTENMALFNLAEKTDISTDRYLRNAQLTKATAVWEGEMDTWPESKTPNYGDLEIRVFKITARPIISQDLLEDSSINMEAEIMNSVRSTFSDYISHAMVLGDSNKKPTGMLTHPTELNDPATRYFGKLGYIPTGSDTGFVKPDASKGINPADALINLIGALKTGYLNNAVWLMNRKTATEIRKWKDNNNNFIWEPSLVQGVPGSILGYTVAYDANMPNVEVKDAYPIAFGDFRRGVLVVQRRGMTIIRDVVTKPGQVIFNTSMRVGSGVQDFDAIKLLKVGTK